MSSDKIIYLNNRYDYVDSTNLESVYQNYCIHKAQIDNLILQKSFDLVLIPGQEYSFEHVSLIGLNANNDFLLYMDNMSPFVCRIFQRGANGYPFNILVKPISGAKNPITIRTFYVKREENL